jgi:hypothetical protein
MTRNTPQHNFMIVYPPGPQPWLRESKNKRLSFSVLQAEPATADPDDPMISDDSRIIILDPWLHLRPEAFTITEHLPAGNPTNLGNIRLLM